LKANFVKLLHEHQSVQRYWLWDEVKKSDRVLEVPKIKMKLG